MGYEIKVIIGQSSKTKDKDGCYFNVISTYDLAKVDLEKLKVFITEKGAKLLSRFDIIDFKKVYYYNENTLVDQDKYGDELIAFDAKYLLEELIEKRKADAYRRYPPLIALLESMIQEFVELEVVLYGH